MERTDLAVTRSIMAADRSLLAWVRTALSMISFGFTIYAILQGLQESGTARSGPFVPRIAGLVLTGLGTFSMLMGTIDYWFRLKDIGELREVRIWRPAFILALILSAMGFFLFVSILVRLL